ncbi:MAG TPA: NAD(P)-dependent oxidoreductase [Deltaproteobacteria bacterium]|nr:NAD(P)-dependent oxidoreductase [Deltaproteobacteria bacterium]
MGRIAFCGLGQMGRGMAGSLLRAGHALRVWNRTPEKARPLVEAGARLASTPAEAAEGAEIAISMVADDAASRAVWLGRSGMLDALESPALVVECSTLSHAWVRALSEAAGAKGLDYLDCPVTGLPDAAARGRLTLLIGGQESALRRAEPFLDAMARKKLVFGPVGAGTAYKLIVNLLGAVEIAATAEAMEIARRAGLDPEQVAEALGKGAAGSFHVARQARIMASEAHAENLAFSTDLRRKDTRYGVALAREQGVAALLGELALERFDRASELGFGAENESRVLEVVRNESDAQRE